MKRGIWAELLLFLLVLAPVLAGCGGRREDAKNAPYKVYHVNTDGTALLAVAYEGETEDPDRSVEEMLECLSVSEDARQGKPAIPEQVKVVDYTLEEEKLSLYFDGAYRGMDTVQEVLCRAALVRTLTQLDSVELVAIYVDGEPLTNRDGEAYGFLQADDFVQNTGSSINSYEKAELTLYFANKAGDALTRVKEQVRCNTSLSREQVIVERLMKGPPGDLPSAIPVGTNLLGVSLRDGICYLNFDEGFLNAPAGVQPEIAVYSIVNSVTEAGMAGSVQISVNGDSNIMYQSSVDLSEPLRRNLDIVEDD